MSDSASPIRDDDGSEDVTYRIGNGGQITPPSKDADNADDVCCDISHAVTETEKTPPKEITSKG